MSDEEIRRTAALFVDSFIVWYPVGSSKGKYILVEHPEKIQNQLERLLKEYLETSPNTQRGETEL